MHPLAPYARAACLAAALALCTCTSAAQPMRQGLRTAALAGSGVATPGDVWAGANPAAPAGTRRPTLSLLAGQMYGLPELAFGGIALSLPLGRAVASASVQSFGYDAYRVLTARAGVAARLYPGTSRPLLAGLSVRYDRVAIERYGTRQALVLDAGWIADLMPEISIGGAARNLLALDASLPGAYPRTLTAGIAYRPASTFQVVADVAKEARFPASPRAGLEYSPVPSFTLRAGMGGRPLRHAAGFSIAVGSLTAGLAIEHHAELGWSPAFGLSCAL